MPSHDARVDSFELIAAGETDRGLQRTVNEDSLLVRGDLLLYVVADGAGGHSAGNVASAIATSAVAKHFDATESEFAEKPEMGASGLWNAARRLSRAVQRANAAVIDIARSSNKYRGMGTTIVCAHLSRTSGRLHVAHVGDSRCYRLRQGILEALTQDHSLLSDVLELHPELEDSAVTKLPKKAVTRALGMEEVVRVSVTTHRALPGDRYLLCSDGLTGELGEVLLAEMLGSGSAPSDVVQDLVFAAKEHGGRDNITALVFDCRGAVLATPQTRSAQKPPYPKAAGKGRKRAGVDAKDPKRDGEGAGVAPENPSDPEIVVMHRSSTGPDTDPRISVVPADSSDAQMIRALDRVLDRLTPTRIHCARCEAEYEASCIHCPRCGFVPNGVEG